MPKKPANILARILIWRYKHISEQQFIYTISILVGFLAGLGSVILKNSTHFIQSLLEGKIIRDYHNAFYFIFPVIGLLLVYLIKKRVFKREIPHGIPSTLLSISKENGIIERYKMYAALITAPITAGFGGSVGLQGPAVSTGAAVGSNIAQLFHLNMKNRMLLIGCAAAGAMASMFKAPIAAIIFAMEIFSLDIAFASLLPLLLASLSAVITSYFFLGTDVLFSYKIKDVFEINEIGFYILLGIGTGLASVYFSRIYFWITNFFDQFKSPLKRLIVGGVFIGVLLYYFPSLYGEGYGLINNLLHGNYKEAIGITPLNAYLDNIWMVILLLTGITILKAVAMTTTFAAGGVGGIFIPTLVMGSAMGHVFAKIINNIGLNFSVSESNFTLIGMAGLIAGVLHAPLTAIFLIAEITGGYELFVPLMLVASISFILTRYFVSNSIYALELAEKGELLTHNKDENVMILMDIDKIIETNFIPVRPEMKLNKMLKNVVTKSTRNIFPIISENDEFMGIMLLDDIREIMFDKKTCKKFVVEDFLQNPPEIIYYNIDSTQSVMEKFKTSGAWNLPVIKDGKYYGFISKSKLLTAYRRKLVEVTS
ncbi:MAG: chloride channel protein [Flavobacteriaceae bacterium]|nr:chloride channel protein [Flavobacteriaceae bacterium]